MFGLMWWSGQKKLGNYPKAIQHFEQVRKTHPEDAQAHYNMMLVNKKLGNHEKAREHQNYYLKYKPDEEALSISQSARLKYPHANNEAQLIHSHELIQTREFSSLK